MAQEKYTLKRFSLQEVEGLKEVLRYVSKLDVPEALRLKVSFLLSKFQLDADYKAAFGKSRQVEMTRGYEEEAPAIEAEPEESFVDKYGM